MNLMVFQRVSLEEDVSELILFVLSQTLTEKDFVGCKYEFKNADMSMTGL